MRMRVEELVDSADVGWCLNSLGGSTIRDLFNLVPSRPVAGPVEEDKDPKSSHFISAFLPDLHPKMLNHGGAESRALCPGRISVGFPKSTSSLLPVCSCRGKDERGQVKWKRGRCGAMRAGLLFALRRHSADACRRG